MSVFCAGLIVVIWLLHLDEYHWPDFCISVANGEAYDFMIEDEPCRIKWSFFMEPVILSALCYLVLVGPVAFVGYMLKFFNNKNAAIHS
jgi:hypothetical protein